MPEIIEITRGKDNALIIHARSGKDIRPDLFNFAVKKNLTILSLKKEEQSIEKVFQALTKKWVPVIPLKNKFLILPTLSLIPLHDQRASGMKS